MDGRFGFAAIAARAHRVPGPARPAGPGRILTASAPGR